MDKITKSYRVYFDSNVLHLIFSNSTIIDIQSANEIESFAKHYSKTLKVLRLIDIRASFSIEPEAQKYFQSQRIKKRVLAQAVLVGSTTNQEIMDFFLEMDSKKLPVKLFVDYNSAIEWLNAFYY